MFKYRQSIISAFLLLILFAFVASAQQETATITGEVKDSNGATVPNASIKVTNTGTNISSTTQSDERGLYTVINLRPGAYSITAEKADFKRVIREGVTLQVNQTARIDFNLEVGATETSIVVKDEAPLLESETSARGAVIDQKKIVDLPLNGRDYNQLALLTPGVLPPTPRLSSANFRGAINVNGNRVFMNVFLLDGVDNVSYSSSYRGDNVQLVQPSVDALQEFKIQTNAYAAEFGRSAGAVINATIKSGTNGFHGNGYEFLRNQAFDANNFFANKAGIDKPERKRNQYGATFGGPIVKDKTFFFVDYEGLHDLLGELRTETVPTLAMRNGVFTAPILNPFNNRAPFANNTIDPKTFDPVAAKILAILPSPNQPVINGNPANDFIDTPVTRSKSDQFDVRIDHRISEKLSIFSRYSFVNSNVFRPGPLPGLAEGSFNDSFGTGASRTQGVALGADWIIGPSMVADFRFGYGRGEYFVTPPNAGINGATAVGLNNVPNAPDIVGGLPKLIFAGGFGPYGRGTSTPQFQTPRDYDTRGSLSILHGQHTIKVGAESLILSTKIRDIAALIGAMTFTGVFTGNAFGDFLLGLPAQLELTSNSVFNQSQKMFFVYAQDDFKVSPKLTLNYGLRYEYANPPIEKGNQIANFDPTTGTFLFAKDGSTFDQALIHPDHKNFAPRLGFAYSPTNRWVVRGAYGIFYNHSNRQGREGLLEFNPPFLVDNFLIAPNPTAPFKTLTSDSAIFQLQNGYPNGILDPNNLAGTVSRRAEDMNQKTPYVQQWNFGIQREIAKDLLLEVSYVGNKGTRLPGFRNINQRAVVIDPVTGAASAGPRPFPQFGDIQYLEDRVLSTYNSLQVRVEKRFSRGFTMLASYTYGKALSDAPDHLSTSGVGAFTDTGVFKEPQNPNNLRAEYGPTEFDIRHRAVISYVWEIPFGHGRQFGSGANGLVDAFLGGWKFTGINTFQTGLPLTIDQNGTGVINLGSERRGRPNVIAGADLTGPQTIAQWFNTAAFTPTNPATGNVFGNAGIGIVRAPGLASFDFNLAKNFRVGETKHFEFRTELFNAFNKTNLGVPSIDINSATFGTITNTSTPARIVQFALKFYF